MNKIETVHVVFKTHLDIGYTDLAHNVIDQYVHQFIPKAIETAEKLATDAGYEQFIWTTGSWLIEHYLTAASDDEKQKMEAAIRKGHIKWHGLPFTTHTELMDEKLFEYGLSISQKLDQRFNKSTQSAKMTDVAGHTIAMVPLLAKYGIRYLHLGINDASKMPSVPKVFVWRARDGSEIIVNYAGSYGDILQVVGLRDVLVIEHTNDNCGPSSIAEIKGIFHKWAERFPEAVIKASSLDTFADELWKVKGHLPVITEEIGDTWIHGVASDPFKVSRYRQLLRLRDKWLYEGKLHKGSMEYEQFCRQLIMIPEHTWGMDSKKYLPDYKNYSKSDFQAARKRDTFSVEDVPDKFEYIGKFGRRLFDHQLPAPNVFIKDPLQRSYRFYESAWQEQRMYLDKAIATLSEDKKAEVSSIFLQMEQKPHPLSDSKPLDAGKTYRLGSFEIAFATDGSIYHLLDDNGKLWSDEEHMLGSFCYEAFGQENYHTYSEQYMVNLGKHHAWADGDYAKPGIDYAVPRPEHKLYKPILQALELQEFENADLVQVKLSMPAHAVEVLGAPSELILEYRFTKAAREIEVTLFWLNKDASRLPEALWFSFVPLLDNPNCWRLIKMGEPISPLEVVKNGNRNLHAVSSGAAYHGGEGVFEIISLDAALVAPGAKRLLQFDNTFAPLDGGMHFNLFNNVWNGNFPLWYEEDAKFRFRLILKSYDQQNES